MPSVTISKIAQACGVSTFTVSAALSGSPRVAEATRDMVCACAEKMGYRRNAAASRVRRRCCETISLVVDNLYPANYPTGEFNEFGVPRDLLCGMLDEVRKSGFDLKLLPVSEQNLTPGEFARYIGYPESDGVIFYGMHYQQDLHRIASELHVPHITVKPWPENGFCAKPSISVNSTPGVRDAVLYLLQKGHTRIAYASYNHIDTPLQQERFSAYHEELVKRQLFDPELIVVSRTRMEVRTRVAEFIRNRHFTALLCHNDLMARAWIEEVKYAGLEVPQDLAVVGYDCRPYFPGLSSVDNRNGEVGKRAAAALIAGIKNGTPPEDQVIETKFVLKGSC